MSSDPKKPGFDAPPSGTPDLLQKDLNLDRRRRVPTFDELQAQKADVATDPLRPSVARPPAPIPQATVPARPSNLDEATQSVQRHVPPGLAPRQPPPPALHIRTPTPPTQPARMAIPPEALPTQTQPRPMPLPPAPPPQQARPPMPPPPQARPPMPPAARPVPAAPPGPQTNTIPVRTPVPPAQPNTIPQRTPVPPAQPNTLPQRAPVPLGTNEPTGVLPQQQHPTGLVPPHRAAPPSPTEFAQARPQVMPQVTPAAPMLGAVLPEGQVPPRPSQTALPTVPVPAPRVIDDEPEPATVPAGKAAPRSFTPPPAPAPVPRPAQLPPEMLVTQPGAPGPFAQGRGAPPPAPPQRTPSRPEMPREPQPVSEEPVFAAPQFDEPQLSKSSDTVTAEPAALWRRTGAWIADLALVGGIVVAFLVLAMAVIAPKNLTPAQQLMAVAVPGLALAAILAFVYTTLFAFLWSGRTPGRRLMGIHLVDSTGHAPSPARALMRAVFSLVSFGLFLSGFWLALFDRHGQTLHDKLTRTFVVKLQDA